MNETAKTESAIARAAGLPLWRDKVDPQPLSGGITNTNFVVSDAGRKYFVRVGDDIPIHGVLRFNELAAARAAEAAGVSPALVFSEPGVMVTDFIEGRTFSAEDVRAPENFDPILDLIRRCHRDMPKHLRGPVLTFWVFHVIRDYAATLRAGDSRSLAGLPKLLGQAELLEKAVGPIDLVFGHNDLLAANFIADDRRLWLIDWDYAGFNSPLFDLGGLASNNEFSASQETALLSAYFERTPDPAFERSYRAMKCASLLRETLWSMVSEIHSSLDFDYVAYTDENLARFERAFDDFTGL